MNRVLNVSSLVLLIAVAACGEPKVATTGPGKIDLPTSDGVGHSRSNASGSQRQAPPSSATAKESPFPNLSRSKLSNGMGVDVVTVKTLPIVQVRVLVRAGAGYAGAGPGVAETTASMLKDGGARAMSSAEVLRKIETLGADLSVRSENDGTVLSLALTKDKVSEGLSILSQVVREPRFDDGELRKLKGRMTDEVEGTLRSSGSWTARWLMFRELYPENHPYRIHGPLPSQIAKIDGNQIREFHRKVFVPKATTLVFAGDIDEGAAKELAQKHFGSWTGGEPPKIDFPPPKPVGGEQQKLRVLLAHRPKSVQSDVFIAMLAPERTSDRWAHVRVANQVLGGGVASRLFSDVRETRSLAYSTASQIIEVAHGPQPLILYAGTESSKTSQAVTGLLENVVKMKGTAPPSSTEVQTARRYLSDIFAIRMETVGSIAEMVVTQETFGLPDGYWDSYRQKLKATEPNDAADMSSQMFTDKGLLIVSGDAEVIGNDLAKFGEVTVFDPEKEFKTLKTIPAAAAAAAAK
jgi:zinc protease